MRFLWFGDSTVNSWNGQFHLINRCRNSILILLVILGFGILLRSGFLLQLGSFVLGFDLDQCWIPEIYDFLKLIRSPDFCDFIEKSRILEEYFFRFPKYKNTGLDVGDVMFIVSQYYFSNYCSDWVKSKETISLNGRILKLREVSMERYSSFKRAFKNLSYEVILLSAFTAQFSVLRTSNPKIRNENNNVINHCVCAWEVLQKPLGLARSICLSCFIESTIILLAS